MEYVGIAIATNNVKRLVDFYTIVLGMKAEGNEVHSAFHEAKLAIWNPEALNKPKADSGERNFTLMFKVEDVDKEYERLKKLKIGVNIVSKPADFPWGTRAFSFKDPEGNNINFLTPLKR